MLLIQSLQTLKESPVDCDKDFSNAAIFRRRYVFFLNFFSHWIIDQVDSDSLLAISLVTCYTVFLIE